MAKRHWFGLGHERGVFARIMAGLAAEHGEETTVMIDATHLKAHRAASSLGVRKGVWASDGPNHGRQDPLPSNVPRGTKLHATCDSQGRPIDLFLTAGPVRDYIGARALLSNLPKVDWLLGDRGYDADWFREDLQDKKIRPCIPGRKKRKTPVRYDKRRYKRRNRPSRDITCRDALPGSDRDHVRQARGLAEGCDPLCPLPTNLLLGNRTRCECNLPALRENES